ncbi:NAD(P)/FAD-dependent oxidoreductase [uncultured Jatrophihabitans sp.]|uniref:NAD(P)/FAD-dependent oxidoreductase n=1 Tax=uncultured Jatrophihabitans sp. TaxID=1610747 RepID=UPI0035CB6315
MNGGSGGGYRDVSLWFDQLAEPITARPALTGRHDADVAIVGAGFTGLWAAYYLQRAAPDLRIALVEAEVAGFGASGRNGGWCSALFPTTAATLARQVGRDAAVAQYAAMRESVAEVERVASAEGIDADIARGGTVVLARSAAQLDRARAEAAESAEFGLGLELLGADEARDRLAASDVLGGTYTPHCAAIQPAKLARGLAAAVEHRGAVLFEHSRATAIDPHLVRLEHGELHAKHVVRATEGYTARLAGHRRTLAPVYSLIVATEPLPVATWDEIGLRKRETFTDYRHLIVYGQRSADSRLVFGGRGAPYHLGSRIEARYDRVPDVFAALEQTIGELLPILKSVRITHRWGGPLGIARDWHASVGLDRSSGLAWAGGYVGDGVSTTNLAGRTLADLITEADSELLRLPWVGHRSRRWEPEPLRWLGANLGLQAMMWADAAEQRSGRPARSAALVNAIMGR